MKKIFFTLLFFAVFFSCKKDKNDQNEIPYVYVDFVVSITQYPSLNSPGGWAYVPGGSRGIVIYRHTLDEFFAMDRHCPYLPANGNQLSVDSTNIFLRDASCGSKFYMLDGGSVANGPATRTLKRYNISYDSANSLHVYN